MSPILLFFNAFLFQPFYGAVAAKLELVTHAWFDQKDFTNTELLRDAYVSLASNLNNTPSNAESEVMIGEFE